jgi:ribosomal protein L15
MGERKRKKKNRLRGHRTHGQGDTKKNRGAGSRGGVGKAGSHKHKYSKYYGEFGGKKAMKPKGKWTNSVQLWRINQALPSLIETGEAKEEGGRIIVDCKKMGIGKIIGPGRIMDNVVFENVKLSKRLAEQVGGKSGEES